VDQVYVYKDVEIPRKLLGIINHMEDVESYREELHVVLDPERLVRHLVKGKKTAGNETA
jgi:hypothetical protein